MTITTDQVATPRAMSEVHCTGCGWTLPAGVHTDPGTQERPGCADYVDAAMPLIGAHIDSTGHPVSVTLTTFHDFRDDEQSTVTFRPRNH